MGERTLTRLRLDGVWVADYVGGGELDPVRSPRPYLHAARDRLTLPPGDAATRGLRALLADGVLDDETAQTWADARGPGFATEPPATAGHNPE
jgi:hypothetical protein